MLGYSKPNNLMNSCDIDRRIQSCNTSPRTRAGLIAATNHDVDDEYRQSPYDLISTAKSMDRKSVDDSERQSAASVWKGSTMPRANVDESDLAAMPERDRNNAPYKIQRRMDKSQLPPPSRNQQRLEGDVMQGAGLPVHEVQLSHEKALRQVKHLLKQANNQNLRTQLLHNLHLQDHVANSGMLSEVLSHQAIAPSQREKWIYNLQPHERFVFRATVYHMC